MDETEIYVDDEKFDPEDLDAEYREKRSNRR